MSVTVARFERRETAGIEVSGALQEEHLHWMWVLGPTGAASTWFSDTRAILGHSVCSGVAVHSPVPRDGFEAHGPCEFLESDCFCWFGSMLWLNEIVEAYDRGDLEVVWAWLAGQLPGE